MHLKVVVPSALALCVAILAAGSHAAPGRESRIAFVGHAGKTNRIYTVDLSGRRRRVVSRFRGNRISDGEPAWSRDGRRLAFRRFSPCRRARFGYCYEIYTSDADGRRARRVTPGTDDGSPAWAPDGSTIAFVREFERGDYFFYSIFVVRSDGQDVRQLTRDHVDEAPAWSPDGTAILFARSPPAEYVYLPDDYRLMLVDADGSNLRSFPRGIAGRMPAWSPTGRRVAFIGYRDYYGEVCQGRECVAAGELYVVNADGTGLRRLTRTRADESQPSWSRDGQWIAYASGTSARGPSRTRIYRIRPAGGRRRLVVQAELAVHNPAWRPN